MAVSIECISTDEAKPWILGRHYARRMPCITHAFGAFVDGVMYGICTFGMPPSYTLCDGVCGPEYRDCVLELNRLCVADDAGFQTSRFLGMCLRNMGHCADGGGWVLVSFADTDMGHIGTIYQATNWLYTGISPRQKYYTTQPENGPYRRRARSSKREIEREGGVPVPYFSSPKHRYVTFVGNRRWCKMARKSLRYAIQPYPRGQSSRYDTQTPIETQTIMF
jgi:hypothetical protein